MSNSFSLTMEEAQNVKHTNIAVQVVQKSLGYLQNGVHTKMDKQGELVIFE